MRRWWRRNRGTEDTTVEVNRSDGRLVGPWWERLITVVLCVIVGTFLLVTFAAVMVPGVFPAWFGVQAVAVRDQDVRHYVPSKTVWDWFGLIAIPLSIVVVGYMLNRADRNHERRLQDQRLRESREVEERRIAENQRIEEKRLADAHAIEQERVQDSIVRDYLDQMTNLLLTHQLIGFSSRADVRSVARARMLTALRGVDGERRATIVQFLYEAQLIGFVDDNGACVGAFVEMREANLRGAKFNEARLEQVNLSMTKLEDATLSGAILIGAKFKDVSLSRADLSSAFLRGADLRGAKLNKASLHRADLRGAKLAGAKFEQTNLEDANLEGVNLSWADLRGANLRGANLRGAKLNEASLHRADLRGAKFAGAELNEVSFYKANLVGISLHKADLRGAKFFGADLWRVDLTGADLTGAFLKETDLSGCQGLTPDQLLQAYSLHGAILPDYIDPADLGDKWSPPKLRNTPAPQP